MLTVMACHRILVSCVILLLSSKIFGFVVSEELCADKDRKILEFQLENDRIKIENYDLRQQNKLLSKNVNYVVLSEKSDSSRQFQTDFEPFKYFIRNKLTKPIIEAESLKKDIFKTVKTREETPIYSTALAQENSESLKRIQNDFESFKELTQNKFAKSTNETDIFREDILKTVHRSEEAAANLTALAQQNLETINAILKKIKSVEEKLPLPSNCAEVYGQVGIFKFQAPNSTTEPFEATCDPDNWMVVLRRMDGLVNFNRDWKTYKAGFGNASGEYFIGLENLHKVTTSECYQLKIEFANNWISEKYDRFEIGNEQELYNLKELGNYSGNDWNSLEQSISASFSTYDRDELNCAEDGGWWYKQCFENKLTGLYIQGAIYVGIYWDGSYKRTAQMMIRPC